MNKIAAFLITLIILTTLVVTITKPALHKQVMITDADFTFVEEAEDKNNTSLPSNVRDISASGSQKTVQPQSVKQEPAYSQNTSTPQKAANNSQTGKSQSVSPKTVQKTVEKTQTPAPAKQHTGPKTTVTAQNTSAQKIVPPKIQQPAVPQRPVQTVKKEEPKTQTSAPTVVRQLTEQEEIIAWNKWRSDLQNQVMKDTKISAPLGTTFKFSFTVDKFGNLSNIKVWSTNPVYSETAVRVIKPVLAGYQGKPILTFPQGTKRIITNVTGGFTMATSTGYSKPSDYSDYERVKK